MSPETAQFQEVTQETVDQNKDWLLFQDEFDLAYEKINNYSDKELKEKHLKDLQDLMEKCSAEKCKVTEQTQELLSKISNDLDEINKNDIMSSLENMSNTKELFDNLVNGVLKNYLDKIKGNEGINLSVESIYDDVVNILDWLEWSIDKNNMYNWKIDIIKTNFLEPKQKALQLIQYLVDISLSPENNDSKEITNKNLENNFMILSSSIWTLIDIAKTSTQEDINTFVEEFKNIPEIKEFLDSNPDLSSLLLETLPNIANTLDKGHLLEQLQSFFNNSKESLLTVANDISWAKEYDKNELFNSRLVILNNIWDLTSNIVTEENVDIFIDSTEKMWIIQNNTFLKEAYILLQSPNLTNTDRFELTKKILDWVKLFTSETLKEDEVNSYLNSLAADISDLWMKIWWDKVTDFINKVIWGGEKKEGQNIEIKDSSELAELLWDNKDKIYNIVKEYFKGNIETMDDVIKYLVDSWIIKENLELSSWKLIERIREIINIDIEKTIKSIREQYVSDNWDKKEQTKETEKKDSSTKDFISNLTLEIQEELKSLVKEKITDKENNTLTKREIIDVTKTVVVDMLQSNPKKFIASLKELWIKIDWKKEEQVILDFSQNILNNEKFLSIIEDIVDNIWSDLSNSENIAEEIKTLIESEWWKFISDYLLEAKEKTIDLWVDFLYSSFLKNTENIRFFIWVIQENTWVNLDVTENNYPEMLNILKEHLNPEDLKQFLTENYSKLTSWDLWLDDFRDLGVDLYSKIKDKSIFLEKIIDKFDLNQNWSSEKKWLEAEKLLTEENIETGIDMIYTTLEEAKEKDNISLINTLIEKFNMSFLEDINVLWQSFSENLLDFLSVIDKDELKQVLIKNKDNIWDIINNTEDKQKLLLNLWLDIFSIMDTKSFQEKVKNNDLKSLESFWLFLTDEVQEYVWENKDKFIYLVENWKKLAHLAQNTKEFEQNDPILNEIQNYWEELFSFISSVLSKAEAWYIQNNLDMSNGESGESKEANPMIEKLIKSFRNENLGFILWKWIWAIFDWFSLDKAKIIEDYFKDPSNKDNFGDTIKAFFAKEIVFEEDDPFAF